LIDPEREEVLSAEQVSPTRHLETLSPEPALWHWPQNRLEPLLLAEAKQRGGDVCYGAELVSFREGIEGVSVTIRDCAHSSITE